MDKPFRILALIFKENVLTAKFSTKARATTSKSHESQENTLKGKYTTSRYQLLHDIDVALRVEADSCFHDPDLLGESCWHLLADRDPFKRRFCS